MNKPTLLLCLALIALGLSACGSSDSSPTGGGTISAVPTDPNEPGPELPAPAVDKRLSGGATTVFTETSTAFETPSPNLEGQRLALHLLGDVAFEDVFVTAPSPVNSGLGPVFNNTACIRCHPRDGRGKSMVPGEVAESIFLRISAGNDPITGPIPAQGFGVQFQHRAVFGVLPEGSVDVRYEDVVLSFSDGESITLRQPFFTVTQSYEALPEDVMLGARVAPPIFGRGLLEAIPESTLRAWADEFDDDNDGISGKANEVIDPVSGQTRMGRFGLKANAVSLIAQNAGAYNQDMGVTSSLMPVESSFAQTQYDELLDDPEVSDETLDAVTFYTRTLGVPARRRIDGEAELRGEQVFADASCTSCHIPQAETGTFPEVPELENQTIFAYTDLLLHDMGENLADNRPDFLASGSEWRTSPLWGIGLTKTVNGHTDFLHDGRARNLMEAILWHGGEAEAAKNYVLNLEVDARTDLISFLNSL